MKSTVLLVLVWMVAVVVVLACAFSALLGRANWGDGQGASLSMAAVAGLVAIAIVAIAIAAWLTRLLSR